MSANQNSTTKRKVLNNTSNYVPFTTQSLDFWVIRICERNKVDPSLHKSIVKFINVFEYYDCDKTLSGPNTPDRHTRTIYPVSVFQDPNTGKTKFVSGSSDNTIKVWDYVTGHCDKT